MLAMKELIDSLISDSGEEKAFSAQVCFTNGRLIPGAVKEHTIPGVYQLLFSGHVETKDGMREIHQLLFFVPESVITIEMTLDPPAIIAPGLGSV